MSPVLAFIGELSPMHILMVLIVGMLLFGKRLPEIGRSLGKSFVEFKKGLKGIEDDIDPRPQQQAYRSEPPQALEPPRPPQRVGPAAPRFDDAHDSGMSGGA
jgi:sec-independent protein translocase protein TatA